MRCETAERDQHIGESVRFQHFLTRVKRASGKSRNARMLGRSQALLRCEANGCEAHPAALASEVTEDLQYSIQMSHAGPESV